jgi:hypothetical protein
MDNERKKTILGPIKNKEIFISKIKKYFFYYLSFVSLSFLSLSWKSKCESSQNLIRKQRFISFTCKSRRG